MTPRIRIATEQDAPAVTAIYAPVVTESAISFEIIAPTAAEMARRIGATLPRLPWLVCEPDHDAGIAGYAYAGRHREREAYQWSVEVSVYVRATDRRRGVGQALYQSLLAILTLQGFLNAYAGITLPNPASVALHESIGFRPVGAYNRVGYKLDIWHDVGWWQKALGTHPARPAPPRALAQIRRSAACVAAVTAGEASLCSDPG
jgi:L-amino acid N-acyltransferase YncA